MNRNNYIKEVIRKVRIEEGEKILEDFLVTLYFSSPLSNKEIARKLLLPIPLVTAIKKEFIKVGLVKQYKGVSMTEKGYEYVGEDLGFKGIDKELYINLKSEGLDIEREFSNELRQLKRIFDNRPEVDLSIDQAYCTYSTSFKRALLALKYDVLVNKKILCIGDDDLVSISIGLLLKKLCKEQQVENNSEIHVVDIDKRLLNYIEEVSNELGLPIICHSSNLRNKSLKELKNSFDCMYTDPPYTLNGIKLFVSRGIDYLKKEKGIPIFFSYAHRSYDSSYEIIKLILKLGLSIHRSIPNFNKYIGASKIGNIGQLYVLNTTTFTNSLVDANEIYNDNLYTREVSKNKNAVKKNWNKSRWRKN